MSSEGNFNINRRQLLKTTMAVLPMLAFPALSEASTDGSVSVESPELTEIYARIQEWEAALKAHPDGFSWKIHNELRHYYGAVSERESRKHSDVILSHSPMDDYILNTISDWYLTNHHGSRQPRQAIAIMLDNARRYHYFPHLRAACLIKSGDVYAELDMAHDAIQCYRGVVRQHISLTVVSKTMISYRQLAAQRLLKLT